MNDGSYFCSLFDLVRQRSGRRPPAAPHLPAAGRGEGGGADHRRTVEAIAAGDAEQARERVREHLSGTLSQADRIRAEHLDYVV